MPTFSDLVQRALVELRQEPGVSVQQYSEDIVAAIMQRVFNTFFDNYWWPVYYTTTQYQLTGTDGTVVQEVTDQIKRFDDIRHIWYESDPKPLNRLPAMLNPYSVLNSSPQKYYHPNSEPKLFKIVPFTLTGNIVVGYRMKPEPFQPNDEVKLDPDLLVLATCYNYLADDDDNSPAVKKFADATGKRESQLREAMNKGPFSITRGEVSPFAGWMMHP